MRFFRQARVLLAGLSVLMLTGCTDSIPELKEEEMQMVEEYAAGLLLQYHTGYEGSILTEEELALEEEELRKRAEIQAQIDAQREAEEELEEDGETDAEGDGTEADASEPEIRYSDIDEFLGLTGLEVNFANWLVCDSYPQAVEENDWQGVTRATGENQLVVFEFTVQNVSGADYYLDMASMDVRFVFDLGNGLTKSSLTTLLTNDFLMYRGTIPAGETVTNVLIIELDPEDIASMENVNLIMKYNGARAETSLVQNGGF